MTGSVRISTYPRLVSFFCTLLAIFLCAAPAQSQQQVFVPGNTNGAFGSPIDLVVPMVSAVTVTGAATITVTYVSGTVTDAGGVNTGPNGVLTNSCGHSFQIPLQQGYGVGLSKCVHLDALIGAFVPQSRTQDPRGFTPIDGTKNLVPVGIVPSHLVLIGTSRTFMVTEPGTLYLGINDCWVSDNGGGFTVSVTVQ